jgi:peptide/nickel transport system substrate-binding protein
MARDGFGGQSALAPVESIAAPDHRTIVITLQYPWAPFASDLAGPGLAILPRHVYGVGDWRTHPANDRPIGSGPFRFGRWVDGETLVLDANPDYFRSGPYVRRIVFEAVPPDAVTARLMRGEADYSVVRPAGIDPLAPPAPLVAHTLPTSARYYLAFNLRHPVFSDVRVRRAMAMALDRLAIVSGALNGLGAPAVGWYTPDVEWAYNAAARVPEFDRRAAVRLLREAGHPTRNAVRGAGTLLVANSPHLVAIAEEIRDQLATVGVRIDVTSLPPS